MKTLKIKFVGMWENFFQDNPHLLKILRKHYNLEFFQKALPV